MAEQKIKLTDLVVAAFRNNERAVLSSAEIQHRVQQQYVAMGRPPIHAANLSSDGYNPTSVDVAVRRLVKQRVLQNVGVFGPRRGMTYRLHGPLLIWGDGERVRRKIVEWVRKHVSVDVETLQLVAALRDKITPKTTPTSLRRMANSLEWPYACANEFATFLAYMCCSTDCQMYRESSDGPVEAKPVGRLHVRSMIKELVAALNGTFNRRVHVRLSTKMWVLHHADGFQIHPDTVIGYAGHMYLRALRRHQIKVGAFPCTQQKV